MASIRTALALLLAAAAARAADVPASVVVRVPVAGTVWGIGGVRWKTNVDLYNDGSRELTIRISLPAADAPDLLFAIPPGSTQRFPDIAEAFSIDQALSPLEIETFDSKRPIRVSVTVYGMRGAELISPEPIPVDYASGGYYPQRTLDRLSFSDTFRTNIGLANLGEREATFTLALQRLPGRNLAAQLAHARLHPVALSDDHQGRQLHGADRDRLARHLRLRLGDRQRDQRGALHPAGHRRADADAAGDGGQPPVTLSFALMDEPEYLICLQCETPTYQFEFNNGKLMAVVCNTCGNDDVTDFMTEAEIEEQTGA